MKKSGYAAGMRAFIDISKQLLLLLSATVIVAGCDEAGGPGGDSGQLEDAETSMDATVPALGLLVVPDEVTLEVTHLGNASQAFQAFTKNALGSAGSFVQATFEVDDTSVGTITADGVFTANGEAAGDVVVTARYGSGEDEWTAVATVHVVVEEPDVSNDCDYDPAAVSGGACVPLGGHCEDAADCCATDDSTPPEIELGRCSAGHCRCVRLIVE